MLPWRFNKFIYWSWFDQSLFDHKHRFHWRRSNTLWADHVVGTADVNLKKDFNHNPWVLQRFPANTRRSPNVGSMLAYRLRRWANIEPTLCARLVFAGLSYYYYPSLNTMVLLWINTIHIRQHGVIIYSFPRITTISFWVSSYSLMNLQSRFQF